ncbi:uncharacterized protein PpBr36_10292 [Pyricularia pennisetigena]|uniref:uncharacterized protein n=1 Tax=Pyricularia pennisetigena TaxID=1578925 RepID=UPI00114EC220|nr:uncharacterized protein PpBr36_10292 [Pyricularia pennisetigena]TLS21560.1 hypothetical protein PpBr36_10292 [Pyricularia pennisetigena]
MQLKTIAASLGLFALHARALRHCKVVLMARDLSTAKDWYQTQPGTFVLPGEGDYIHTAAYKLKFKTSDDCRTVTIESITGRVEHLFWKLEISTILHGVTG